MLPNIAPSNPTNDPSTIRHPNFMGYEESKPTKYTKV
jgi:hypothetical protein